MPHFDISIVLEPPSVEMLLLMWSNTKTQDLDLSVRTLNCLQNARITTVAELAHKTETELLKIKNLGRKSLIEIRQLLFYFYEFTDEIYTYNVHSQTFIERIHNKQQRRIK